MSTLDSASGQVQYDELKIYYPDDPDPEKAGQGLALAPLILQTLRADRAMYWLMSPAEQAAISYLLERLRPEVAIEIGTRFGGSLQVLSRFSGKVYSLDIDPAVPQRLDGLFPNVEYVIGPSDQTLPALIADLQSQGAGLSFVLIDGDHSAEGVKQDIDHILQYRPNTPLYIIMHDSFNPECRRGMASASWAACPYIHAVELDFVGGYINPSPAFRGELWGGLALGLLRPEPRQGRFEIVERAKLSFEIAAEAERRQLAHRRGGPRGLLETMIRTVTKRA